MRYSQLDYFTVSETKIDKSFPSVQYLLGYFEIRARQGVSRKIKTDDVFSKLRNYTSVYERLPPVGDKKNVFATTRKRLENTILVKRYFRAWFYTIHTNHNGEMLFSLFIVKLIEISNRNK